MLPDTSACFPGPKCVLLIVCFCLLLSPGPAAAPGPASLAGTVTDAGSPLVGGEVQLRNVETGEVPHRTTTDPDGTYQFDRIRPGSYAPEVKMVGYGRR